MAEAVTAGLATTNLQKYANELYQSLIAQTPALEYNARPEAQLRDNLLRSYRSGYEQSVANRRQATRQNRGAIDADAASRGMGSSTWVTDAKLRQSDNEARDLTSLRANRDSTIAQQLASALGNQEDNVLAVNQYNAGLRANALNNALSTAGAMYDKFRSEDPSAASGGGGATATKRGNPNPKPNPNPDGDTTGFGDEFGAATETDARGRLWADHAGTQQRVSAAAVQEERIRKIQEQWYRDHPRGTRGQRPGLGTR